MVYEVMCKPMPIKVEVVTMLKKNGQYLLIINEQLNKEKKNKALEKGKIHIKNNDLTKKLNADEIEAQYIKDVIWVFVSRKEVIKWQEKPM